MNTVEPTGCSSEYTQTYRILHLLRTYPSLYLHNEELATVLYTENEKRVGLLFYTLCLMMGQEGPKHVRICVLKHYDDSNEVCTFVGGNVTINRTTVSPASNP